MSLKLRWVVKRKGTNNGKETILVVEKKKSKRMDDIYLSLLHVCFCLELSHCFRIICRNIFLTVELPL